MADVLDDHGRGSRGAVTDEVKAAVTRRLRVAGCVFAEEEARLLVAAARDSGDLPALVAARVAGEPLEQLLGWVAFAGLRLAVGPGVFVPRVRTELLAEQALAVLGGLHTTAVVVELCCGVGAVSAVLQRSRRDDDGLELYAADIDAEAATYARANLAAPAVVVVGDLWQPVPDRLRGRVDLVVANAPYVPTAAVRLMPREAREHEPRQALDGGPDGTEVQGRIIAETPRWLSDGGALLIETGREQSVITATLMRDHGFIVEVVVDDDRDATVVVGTTRAGSS